MSELKIGYYGHYKIYTAYFSCSQRDKEQVYEVLIQKGIYLDKDFIDNDLSLQGEVIKNYKMTIEEIQEW